MEKKKMQLPLNCDTTFIWKAWYNNTERKKIQAVVNMIVNYLVFKHCAI